MPVLGIGTDILVTSRILAIISRSPGRFDRFARKILHPSEHSRLSSDPNDACRLLASTWAAKEALYKSLEDEDQKIFQFKHWYRTVKDGKRVLKNDNYEKEDHFFVSVSHDGDYTSAFVVRTGKSREN
jgi:holo-[acyl-carrier protein] synthase